MSPRRAIAVTRGLRWTLILFGLGLLVTAASYVRLHDQQNTDRTEARVTAVVAKLTAERHNSIVCVTRPYLEKARERARQAENDMTQSDSARARARSSRISSEVFLSGLLTVPPDYDCGPLIKKLRAKAQHDKP